MYKELRTQTVKEALVNHVIDQYSPVDEGENQEKLTIDYPG